MPNWQCTACDSYNPDTVDECQYCGVDRSGKPAAVDGRPDSQLEICPSCQGTNPRTRPLCQWCGERLRDAEVREPPVASSPGAARPGSFEPAAADGDQVAVPTPFGVNARTDPGLDQVIPDLLPPSPRARPCDKCGIMLETEEGIVVAGPRLLCRACFHEEFTSKGKTDPSQPEIDLDEEGEEAEGGTTVEVRTGKRKGRGKGAGLLVAGILVTGGGAAVTWLYTLTWGFTPLALGAVLALAGLVYLIKGGGREPLA